MTDKEKKSPEESVEKKTEETAAKSAPEEKVEEKEKVANKKPEDSSDQTSDATDAKAAAIAKAKAKAAAAKKAKAAGAGDGERKKPARKKKEAPVDNTPSPNQPILDKFVKVIKENLGDDVLEDSYINKLSKHVPTLVAKPDTYLKLAEFLRFNEQLAFDYLSEIHGSDFETHMEVYAHLFSFQNKQAVALKVKIDRDKPEIDSVTPIWDGANWPEREAYDLLGIIFKGHPNLERILMPDDWIGYPLRKDYEQYDVEV